MSGWFSDSSQQSGAKHQTAQGIRERGNLKREGQDVTLLMLCLQLFTLQLRVCSKVLMF